MSLKETIEKYEEKCNSLKEEYDNLCQVRDWLIMLNEMRENAMTVPPLDTYFGTVNKYDWKEPIG